MSREVLPRPTVAVRPPWWIGPTFEGCVHAKAHAVAAARSWPPSPTGLRRFAWWRVPGAPESLAAIVNQLLSLAAQRELVAEREAELQAQRGVPTIDGYRFDGPRVLPWHDRDCPAEICDLAVELVEAVPPGADLRGVEEGLLGTSQGAGPGGRWYSFSARLSSMGHTERSALLELGKLLADAPAWPAEVPA